MFDSGSSCGFGGWWLLGGLCYCLWAIFNSVG